MQSASRFAVRPALRRFAGLIFVCVVLFVAGGCGAASPTATPTPAATPNAAEIKATADAMAVAIEAAYPLAATAWDLEYFGPPETKQPVMPDTRASVYFFWDRYTGFDGCNWFLGGYEADQTGKIQVYEPARTNAICEVDALEEQSIYYSSSLLNATNYVIEDGQLIINTVENQRLLTHNPALPLPMLGTRWDLKLWWWADGDKWNPVLPESSTTITFAADGEASGLGGCNSYTAPVEGDLQIEKVMEATDTYAELPTLRIGPIAAQTATCADPENIMQQEQAYFAALNATAYYFKLGGMLLLMDAQGTPLLMLAAGD